MNPRRLWLFGLLISLMTTSASAKEPWPTKRWSTSTPRAAGLNSKALVDLDQDLVNGKYGHVDSMLIIRHGKVVCDRSFKHDYDQIYGPESDKPGPLNAHDPSGPYNYLNPWWHPYYRRGDLHTLQSVTKTITSIIIGIATTRKDFPALDTPILNYFDVSNVANVDDRKRHMTIRHLMTMRSGLDWKEDLPFSDPNNLCSQMEASADWVRFTVDRPMAAEPGKTFMYNSGGVMLLAQVFRTATGKDLEEYGARYLFTPLGITDYPWKRSPSGEVDAEGGLYLRPSDLAKIWYLVLRSGTWEGQQIVDADWLRDSLTPQAAVPSTGLKYGRLWWFCPYPSNSSRGAWAGIGFGGQLPIVFPDYDMVVVFTGWNLDPEKPQLELEKAIERVLRVVAKESRAGSKE